MEIQLITHGTLGLISDVTPPKSFPMRGLRARQFAGKPHHPDGRNGTCLPAHWGAGPQHVACVMWATPLMWCLALTTRVRLRPARTITTAAVADVTERQAIISAMNTSMLAELLPLDLMRVGALSAISSFPPLRSW